MINKIKNMIKSGLGKSFEDDGDIQIGKSKFLGRFLQTVESLVPYGTFGTPMKNVRQILLNLRSNESNIAAINSDSVNRIKKNTKPGEYGIGSPLTGANIYFKEDGSLLIEVPKEAITKFLLKGDFVINIESTKKIGLGEDGSNPLAGVVTGECISPFTGAPFPDKSTSVFARKI